MNTGVYFEYRYYDWWIENKICRRSTGQTHARIATKSSKMCLPQKDLELMLGFERHLTINVTMAILLM